MRLPGAIAFASPCTRPNMFGRPGLRREVVHLIVQQEVPCPATTTAEPKLPLSVVVSADRTALVRPSPRSASSAVFSIDAPPPM